MSGCWLIPATGYYGPTGKNGVAKMASLRLRIGAQITRKYAHNLLIDLYMLNFYGKPRRRSKQLLKLKLKRDRVVLVGFNCTCGSHSHHE